MVGGTSTLTSAAEGPHAGHIGRPQADGHCSQGPVAAGVAVRADHHRARAVRSRSPARIWWQMPPSSPRMSWNLVIPCAATNSRIFFWLVAVLAVSAGTRWSKTMAIFAGSHTRRLETRALEDLEELVHDQSRVLVRHGQVDRRLHHRRRPTPRPGRPPGPGSSQRRSFPQASSSQASARRSSVSVAVLALHALPGQVLVLQRLVVLRARRSRCIPRTSSPTASVRAGSRWATP